jgi:energy-converting hydrogenase Eha subunit B
LETVTGGLATDIATNAGDIDDLEASVNSIESAFVKDPLGLQRFVGNTALESSNQAGGTLARSHKAQLSSVIEGGVAPNVIGVYINGLVADPAYYVVTSDGVSGNSEVAFETSYALDANDTIVVKFVVD